MPLPILRFSVRRALRCLPLLAALEACAGRGPGVVSPQEVPDLAARLQKEPGNSALLVRYAAALFAAGNCDSAQAAARRAMSAKPDDGVPVMVAGQCQERAGQHDAAIATYDAYLTAHPKANGAPAVRARQMLARRDQATGLARRAMIQEQQLAQQPGDSQTIGILPLQIVGDSSYQPLSRGLAQMIISDIGVLRRFRMVERLQIGALLEELKFSQGGRVDPATAARVGRLIQAGRMVQGLATIPSTGPVRLDASVVQRTGEVANADQVGGPLRELLRLEKELVVSIVTRLGYTLSIAERQAILENGTQNLQALLAYSRGLEAEDAGEFSRAAAYFSDAVQADPGFQAARDEQQSSAAATMVQEAQGGQVADVVSKTGAQDPSRETPAPSPVDDAVRQMAGTTSENTSGGSTNTGNNTNLSNPTTPTREGTSANLTGIVRLPIPIP